jgi:hypothetical protein
MPTYTFLSLSIANPSGSCPSLRQSLLQYLYLKEKDLIAAVQKHKLDVGMDNTAAVLAKRN